MNKQSERIAAMSDREVLLHLYVTQVLLLAASAIIGIFVFDGASFRQLWRFDAATVIAYGGGGALAALALDFWLMRSVPKEWYDDGGINEKIFQTRSIPHLLFLCALIAFSEELLFRGVIQTHAGLWIASAIFAVLHVRYLSKWLLFAMVMVLSFFLGYLYEWTGSLWVTIFAHFLIDFVLAVRIRLDYLQTTQQGD